MAFVDSKQRSTLGDILAAVQHLIVAILRYYTDKVIPVHTGPVWPNQSLYQATSKWAHVSAFTPEMVVFIHEEMRQRIWDGFSILLPVAGVVRLFRDNLKLSRISVVPQGHRKPHLILNLLAKINEGNPSFNNTTYREVAPN